MKNRKMKLILTGLALLVVTVGTTYAWWTASSKVEQQVIMGNLAVTAEFEDVSDNTDFEPGLSIEQNGTVTNSGSIDAIIKVESDSQVKLGNAADFTRADDEAVKLSIKPAGGAGYWYSDSAGGHYLLLSPGETATINVNTDFVGEKMDADYANAEVKVAGNLKATQVLEGAIKSEFGVDAETLQEYVDPDAPVARSQTARGAQSEAMSTLHQLLNRGK